MCLSLRAAASSQQANAVLVKTQTFLSLLLQTQVAVRSMQTLSEAAIYAPSHVARLFRLCVTLDCLYLHPARTSNALIWFLLSQRQQALIIFTADFEFDAVLYTDVFLYFHCMLDASKHQLVDSCMLAPNTDATVICHGYHQFSWAVCDSPWSLLLQVQSPMLCMRPPLSVPFITLMLLRSTHHMS